MHCYFYSGTINVNLTQILSKQQEYRVSKPIYVSENSNIFLKNNISFLSAFIFSIPEIRNSPEKICSFYTKSKIFVRKYLKITCNNVQKNIIEISKQSRAHAHTRTHTRTHTNTHTHSHAWKEIIIQISWLHLSNLCKNVPQN